MQAIQVTRSGGPEVLAVLDLPEPSPGEGQVAVKVEAAGVNYCALRNLGGPREDNAQSGGEFERGGGPPLSVGPAGRAPRLPAFVQAWEPSPRTKRCGRIGKPKFRNAE